jgi:predicted CopG family antitoxin
MHRKLTITIDEDVYNGLHQTVGRGQISRFVEDLLRPYVASDSRLEADYREMAADTEREQEALEWIESHVDECLE